MKSSIRATALAAALCATLGGAVGHGSSEPVPAERPLPSAALVTAPVTAPVTAQLPAAPAQVGRPTRVLIPAIGVDEKLAGVGLKPDGAMQTPAFGSAGWYDRGPRPGARGPAVIVAHVHGPAGDDVFADLKRLRRGDLIRVDRVDGSGLFVVDAVELSAKEALPVDRIWAHTEKSVLRLITCGGTPNPVTRMYPDNTVVYAHRIA